MSSGQSWVLGGALLMALGAASLGCGGISPGDYVIYRVATTDESKSTGCYPPDYSVPPDEKSDSSTFLSSGDYILYAGIDDVYYLDTGTVTLEGTGDGDTFQFSGRTIDINYANPDGTGDKYTSTTTLTIDMTLDGASVSGTSTGKVSSACKGTTCGDAIPTCTTTQDFVGTEVEDVELEHSL